MSDIVKLREWLDEEGYTKNGDGDWEWPHPPINIESRIEGDLRARILTKLGHPIDSTAEVRLIETEVEGGWSEWTSDVDHYIEVWIHEGRLAQRVYDSRDWTPERALAGFLEWVE